MLADILSRFWWMTLLRGVIAILFGVAVFFQPQISLLSLVLVFGFFALVDGVASVATAIGGRRTHESWGLLLLGGLAGIGVGLLTIFSPEVTTLALLFYIAIWAIATGLLEIAAAIRLRKEIEGEFWLGLAGAASIAFGVILVVRPGVGALAVLTVIAAYAIFFGSMLVLLALRTRGFVNRVRTAVSR
jgi:uncharacterized membrane protein HdeD (DUF308 family)